jgi:flagellar protein FlaI
LVERTRIRDITVRRVLDVSEITGVDYQTGRAVMLKIYEWDHERDSFNFCIKSARESFVFKKISELRHVSLEYLERELERREGILKWMVRRNIKNYDDVADVVRKYYLNPEEIYNRTRLET